MPFMSLLLLAVSAVTLCACGSGEKPPVIEREDTSSMVTVLTADQVRNLDPQSTSDGADIKVAIQMYETLVAIDPADINKLQPSLATGWKVSEDGMHLTFTLRAGVRFHDDTPFNADAVVLSLDRLIGRAFNIKAEYRPDYQMMTAVRATDPMTVVITLDRPATRVALRNLAMFPASIISPRVLEATRELPPEEASAYVAKHACGTGPFKLASSDLGHGLIRLTANQNYWRFTPQFKTLVFQHSSDENARFERLSSGSADVVDDLARSRWDEVATRPEVSLHRWWAPNVCYLGLNARHEKTRDIAVRRAIQLAVQREDLLPLYFGSARATHSLLSPGFVEHDPSYRAQGCEVDLETRRSKAKELLASAGAVGRELNLYCMTDARPYLPQPAKVADKLRQQLEAIGLVVRVEMVSNSEYFAKIKEGQYELALIGWTSDNGDADNFYSPLCDGDEATGTPSVNNTTRLFDSEVHRLLVQAQQIEDSAKRSEVYRKVERRMQDELVGYVPLVNTQQAIAINTRLSGIEVDALGHYRFHATKLDATKPRRS